MKKIKNIEHYISIQTVVMIDSEDCNTNEDASALVKSGAVEINGKVITDPFYGIARGDFTIAIKGGPARFRTFMGLPKHDGSTIKRVINREQNLTKLQDGQSLQITVAGRLLHITMPPPKFTGDTVIACLICHPDAIFGKGQSIETCSSTPKIGNISTGITECGTKV